MSERLDKATAALDAARDLDPLGGEYHDLLRIAHVQAVVAHAEATERIAAALEQFVVPLHWVDDGATVGPPEPAPTIERTP